MPIQLLAEEVASQIAAGEVIERPASVVKELLENAIDSGATRITIRVENAGKRLIEVSDNGCGIPSQEIELAVSRHATSKLTTAEDLFHIRTLGFRGEALASIGSVARLSVISQTSNQNSGMKLIIEGGKTISSEVVGGVVGTIVRVENLFFNTPARLKFLKRDITERQQIDGLVTRYGLAYPDRAIHLEQDAKPVLRTTGNGDRREILSQLYGLEFARGLLEVSFKEDGFTIEGFTSPLTIHRSNRKDITFFVNGRYVTDIGLMTALVKAYQTYLMVGRYPLAVLFLEIPPEEVDVNVHPAKSEVRFRDPDLVFTSLQRAIRRAILAYSPLPQIPQKSWQSAAVTPPPLEWQSRAIALGIPSEQVTDNTLDNAESSELSSNPEMNQIPLLRLIGQVGATYLVAEGPDGLYLIDQHAAHERILFEKLLRTKGKHASQALLEPALIQLPPQSAGLVLDNLDVLTSFGFEIEEFGNNSVRVRALPAIFTSGNPRAAIQCLVEDFEEDETPLQAYREERLVARICKRMAVKGGMVLSTVEQETLLRDLETCAAPRTCPHGRPTMIHLPVDLLERQFGRRGARGS
jgi:DNA mismatch repair protein MutL